MFGGSWVRELDGLGFRGFEGLKRIGGSNDRGFWGSKGLGPVRSEVQTVGGLECQSLESPNVQRSRRRVEGLKGWGFRCSKVR